MKLAVKLALGLMVATALVLVLLAWQLRNAQLRAAEQMVNTSAERIGDVIRRGTRFQMLRNDREALYRMIRDIGSEPDMRRVRIFSKVGQISFSTDDSEISRVVNKNAEACYGCHAQEQPLQKLNRSDRARVFRNASTGERILGVILPVENQPDCWNASCHIHPRKQTVLGVIDVQLSLAGVDAEIASQQKRLLWFTAIAIAVLGLLTASLIWWMVYRPVQDLTKGIRRVAKGMLGEPIPIRGQDEIAEVAGEFNHMTSELQFARQEVDEWTRTLEDRVARKSRELERAHHSLLHSEKLASVGKLAATVAHEINNPLFGILTNARLARKNVDQSVDLPADQKTKINAKLVIIERESQRCGEIVKNLLTFSRQAPPKLERVRMETVIERAVALIRHSYQLQNITLTVEQDQSPDAEVMGDAGQLQQVLLVLLSNASEALEQGGHVWVRTRLEPDGTLILTVRDDGPGMTEEVRDHIFEPFFTTKQDGHRTGLGLAIASGIIEQHQGRIRVESEPGKGTEFEIRLPAVALSSSSPLSPSTSSESAGK